MSPELCALLDWKLFGAWILAHAGLMSIEAWLGKTDKVKSGSILELICNGIKFILSRGKNG